MRRDKIYIQLHLIKGLKDAGRRHA
ncbi:uncharacterized protein METZ01_LOCUS236383 [marine metagenome]|uniref:Uncharacterized protein n=1 Tax=marine metagenome TaxID=408172 RepID=A0A382H8R2_9ZZZZ